MTKTMADVLAEHVAHRESLAHCSCGNYEAWTPTSHAAHQAAALTAAGYGLVADAKREALLRQGAAMGWDAAVSKMTYEDGTPVEIAENVNPYRAAEMRQG